MTDDETNARRARETRFAGETTMVGLDVRPLGVVCWKFPSSRIPDYEWEIEEAS